MATPGLGTEESATRLHDLNDSAFVIGVPMGGKATRLNARIELHDMDFVTLFEALDEGRIDMGLAGLNKDTNRPDQVLYSDNYIDSYIVAIVHTSLVETCGNAHCRTKIAHRNQSSA